MITLQLGGGSSKTLGLAFAKLQPGNKMPKPGLAGLGISVRLFSGWLAAVAAPAEPESLAQSSAYRELASY
jgi:hypothetical protein